jgi:hypothetical protein
LNDSKLQQFVYFVLYFVSCPSLGTRLFTKE